MNWLKHAFALDDGTPTLPTPEQQRAIDRVLSEILRRGLELPASMILEACRPLNYVGGQLLRFFSPSMRLVLGTQAQDAFAQFLEKRESIDYMQDRLDTLKAQRKSSVSDGTK